MAALLLLFTHREGCAEKNKIGFCFVFDTGTQSIAVSDSVRTSALSHSPGFLLPSSLLSCLYVCVSCYRLLQEHPAWSNGAMEHLDPQETQDSTRICRFRTTFPVQGVRTWCCVYSGTMYGCVRYVLRVARVDSGWGVQILLLLTWCRPPVDRCTTVWVCDVCLHE